MNDRLDNRLKRWGVNYRDLWNFLKWKNTPPPPPPPPPDDEIEQSIRSIAAALQCLKRHASLSKNLRIKDAIHALIDSFAGDIEKYKMDRSNKKWRTHFLERQTAYENACVELEPKPVVPKPVVPKLTGGDRRRSRRRRSEWTPKCPRSLAMHNGRQLVVHASSDHPGEQRVRIRVQRAAAAAHHRFVKPNGKKKISFRG